MFVRLITLPLLASCAHGDLIARVLTDKGTIDVQLQYEKAPLAVANFITMAEGTRMRIDPETGQASDAPLYVGETFFRTSNSTNFKFAQTGSGTGSNSGSTGFTFRDEFDPGLKHLGYTLSMANSGPNTNGGQIFFTGDVSIPSYDGVHTVFGLVIDEMSRDVVDAVINAGNGNSSISDVTFERTDGSALAFDELAQGLPTVSPIKGDLAVEPSGPVVFHPFHPIEEGSLLSVSRSSDFLEWTPLDEAFAGYDSGPRSLLEIDTANEPRGFYHLARIAHPGSPTPSSLANRTLVFPVPGSDDTVTMTFDADGTGGISQYSPNESPGTIDLLIYSPRGYGATLIVDASDLVPLRLVMSFDGEDGADLTGRFTVATWNGLQWNPAGSGTHALTK